MYIKQSSYHPCLTIIILEKTTVLLWVPDYMTKEKELIFMWDVGSNLLKQKFEQSAVFK